MDIEYKDGLTVVTEAKFDFMDALKLLMGWTLSCSVQTNTQNKIGATEHVRADMDFIPPKWWPRKQVLYEDVCEEGTEEDWS